MLDKEPTRAGFGVRAAAYIVDRAILLIPLLILRCVCGALSFGTPAGGGLLFDHTGADVLCWALSAAYFVLLTYFCGATLGKKVFRLRVEKREGGALRFIDVLYRETVGRYLSSILCLGYLMVLADREHRAFHDWLCACAVVYDGTSFRVREDRTPAGDWSLPGESPARPEPEEPVPAPADPEPETDPAAAAYSLPGENGGEE